MRLNLPTGAGLSVVDGVGVQLTLGHPAWARRQPTPQRSYEPGDSLWEFFNALFDKLFPGCKQSIGTFGLSLVRVDVGRMETQFSFKKVLTDC